MANHCHRDRRSLSIRPGKRSRFVQNAPLAGLAGTEARMQATAKNPDRSKPSRAVRSFITTLHGRYRSDDRAGTMRRRRPMRIARRKPSATRCDENLTRALGKGARRSGPRDSPLAMTRTFGRMAQATVLFPNGPKVGVPSVGDSSYDARAPHLPWIWRKHNSVRPDSRHDEIVEMVIASCKAPGEIRGRSRAGQPLRKRWSFTAPG